MRFDRTAAAKALSDDGTMGTVLLVIALDTVDGDIAGTDTDEIVDLLEDTFGTKIPDENVCRLNASIILLTTDYWKEDPGVFESAALALDDGDIDGDADANQMLWALMEASVINGDSFAETMDDVSPRVAALVNRTVESEAEDVEDIDPEDGLDDIVKIPFYWRGLRARLHELVRQVTDLAGGNAALLSELEAHCSELLGQEGMPPAVKD